MSCAERDGHLWWLTRVLADLDHASLSQRIPLGRLGKPEEIASAALFLARNEYAHNCVINLDGGLSAVVLHVGLHDDSDLAELQGEEASPVTSAPGSTLIGVGADVDPRPSPDPGTPGAARLRPSSGAVEAYPGQARFRRAQVPQDGRASSHLMRDLLHS